MRNRCMLMVSIVVLAGGCGKAGEEPPPPEPVAMENATPSASPDKARSANAVKPPPTSNRLPPLLGEAVVRTEWGKAANRATCAPLALRSDAKAGGTPRAATFSDGWAVAFDQPDRRSAYGLAGSGLMPDDRADFAVKVDRLAKQWPYVRRWDKGDNLPAGSAAGYGLEGARDYPSGSSGYGQQSLAYLRIPGQACLYNVWSKLGRDHLELLLSELVLLKP